jgi:hypothetical protein
LDGLDDTKEAIKIKKEEVVRQDFACISSKAKNKELVFVAEKSFGAKGIDDDTKEEAETEVGTSTEQEKPLADNTNNAEKLDIVEEVEMERSEDKTDDDDPGEDDREHFIKGDGFKDDSEDTADEEVMKQDEALKTQEIIKKEAASTVVITDATGMNTEVQEGVREDTVEVDKDETDEEDMKTRRTRFSSTRRTLLKSGQSPKENPTAGKKRTGG